MVVPPASARPLSDTRYNIGRAVESESWTSTMVGALDMGESIVRDSMTTGESLMSRTASTPPDTYPVAEKRMERDLLSEEEAPEATRHSAPSPSQTQSRREQATLEAAISNY